MNINLAKTSHILFFVVFLPAVSLGLGWLLYAILPSDLPFWVETLSPLAAYALLYGLFDKHIWHWSMFRALGIVTTPDVRGRWLGEQTSSFTDESGKPRTSRVILEISQTFSQIKANTFYKNWRTEHSVASFIDIDGTCILFILFETAPKPGADDTAEAHKGVMRLAQTPSKQLNGTYFNAMGRSGELNFKRTRYTLHQTFEKVGK